MGFVWIRRVARKLFAFEQRVRRHLARSKPGSRTDLARFVEIATGFLFEVVSQATVAHRQSFLSKDQFERIYDGAEKQSRMLSGLRRSLLDS